MYVLGCWRTTGQTTEVIAALLLGVLFLRYLVSSARVIGFAGALGAFILSFVPGVIILHSLVQLFGDPRNVRPLSSGSGYLLIGVVALFHFLFDPRIATAGPQRPHFQITKERIINFWKGEAGRRQPSGTHGNFSNHGARAAITAQELRKKWLERDAEKADIKLEWARVNAPEAYLYAEAETWLVTLATSGGRMLGSAVGGFGTLQEDAERHYESVMNVFRICDQAKALLRSATHDSSLEYLGRFVKQMEAVVGALRSMYGSWS